MRPFLFAILTLCLSSVATRSQSVPRFEKYPAVRVYNGKNAKAIIDKDSRTYRTRVRWAAANGRRDFAGEYILGQIGCGAECRLTFALNARTGRVSWLPFTICCWRPLSVDEDSAATVVRLKSRLITLRGLRNEGNGDYARDTMTDTHYYEIKNGEFRHIKTIKQK